MKRKAKELIDKFEDMAADVVTEIIKALEYNAKDNMDWIDYYEELKRIIENNEESR